MMWVYLAVGLLICTPFGWAIALIFAPIWLLFKGFSLLEWYLERPSTQKRSTKC